MKKTTKILFFVLIAFCVLSFVASSADYVQNENYEEDTGYIEELAPYQYKFDGTVVHHGTATPFEKIETGKYGRLIYRQDFETGYMGDYKYDASYSSPYALGKAKLSSPVYVYNADGDMTNPDFSIINDPTGLKGGKVLAMTGTTFYPIYKLMFKGDIISKPGKYTVVIHANGLNTDIGVVRFHFNRLYDGVPEMGGMNFDKTSFAETAYSFTIINPEEYKATGLPEATYTTKEAYAFQLVYFFMANYLDRTVYFDDIEVWYEEYADIKFHLEGPTDEVTEAANVTFGNTSRSFEPGKELPSVSTPGTGYIFAGWSTVKGDDSKIVDTAKIEYTDLYAIYEEANGRDLIAYNGKLTVYEAIILVSKLNAEICGNKLDADATFTECLAYAEDEELLPQTAFDRYDRAILRSEMAEMLYAALPEDVREEINNIEEIPDVKEYDNFEEAVLALYKAGIFMGTDAEGSFDSYDGILRADFDTIVSRILFNEKRVNFNLNAQEIKSIMLYDTQHGITAKFISAPASFIESFNEYPESTYNLGNWVAPASYTRTTMRRDFTVSKTLEKAVLELQSDSYIDFYINGNMYTAEKEGLWYLTGLIDITEHVVSGNNKMAIRMYLSDSPEKFLVAFRGTIVLTYSDGTTENLTFDRNWHSKDTCGFWVGKESDGWYTEDLTTFYNARTTYYTKYHPHTLRRGAYFRTTFDSSKTVESATLYSGAQGLYVPYINGERVTDNRFLPGSMSGFTEYQVFDVTKLIKNGTNVIAAETGNGWFNCVSWGYLSLGQPAVMMQLEIKYTDGSSETIKTDETWLTTVSPRTEDDIQFGERYDARLEIDGWNSAKNPDGTWENVEVLDRTLKPFANQTYPAVRIHNEERAVSMGTLADGTTYYDFKYNSAGRAKIVLKNTKPGEMVIIRYCEIVENDVPYVGTYGDVYFEQDTKAGGKSCYGTRNIDVYICKGAEEEVYIPEFAYTGFRYIYISGYSGEYDFSTVRKLEMNSDLEQTGDIVTSHAGITKIWDAVKRSWRSNIVSGPTDCPTREKNFWNGDIQVFATTASWYNDTNAILARWTEAGTKIEYNVYGWEDEEYILPLILYKFYGNKEIIEIKYPVVQALITKRTSGMVSGSLPSTDARYGDHLAYKPVDRKFFTDAYHTYMFKCASEMAEILGKTEDAAKYMAEFEACRATFNSKYYIAAENDYTPRVQGGLVFPIAFGIANEEEIPELAETLNNYVIADDYHLTTGFMGNEFNLGILCDYGYGETAWKALTNESSPSLLHMLSTFEGGTTTEGWDGYSTFSGSSMNHYSVGCLSRWFFEHLGGITITSPGFETVSLKPYFFEEMGDCDVTYMSDYGLIESKWVYDEANDVFNWTVSIPDGITADVSLPDGVTFVTGKAGEYTGGTYEFVASKDEFVPVKPVKITVASAPAAYDEKYGHLVFFDNFKYEPVGIANLKVLDEGESAVIDSKYVVKGNNTGAIGDQKTSGIELVSADGVGNVLKYKDGTPITGDITVLYQAYNADGSVYNMNNVANDNSLGSNEWLGYYVDWSGAELGATSWASWASKTITISDTLTRYGTRASELDKNIYFHSVAVYVKSDSLSNSAIEGNAFMSGMTGAAATFKFIKAIDAEKSSFTAGTTDVTSVVYDGAANTCTVTAAGYSGILTLNVVFADGTTGTEEIKLLGGEKWKPGLNLITGTTETFDLEVPEQVPMVLSFEGASFVANPMANGVNMSSNVICMSGENAVYPLFTTKMTQTIEKQRGVYVKFDFVGSWNAVWLVSQPNAVYQDLSSDPNLQNNSEEWKTFGTYALNPSGLDFNITRLQFMSAWDGKLDPKTAYIDNLAFIPAYKFTYVMPDGTEEYDYKITDENGNIITTYAPNKTAESADEFKKFVGWALTEDGEVVETVALANADVTFYPVFEEIDSAIEGNAFMLGKTGTAETFKFIKAIDAEESTFTAGTTDVTSVVYDEATNTCTVTAAGYSGILTLNVVFADGTTRTEEIKLLGGEKWKPGLNLITGTTETFDIEGLTEEQIHHLALTLDPGASVVANPMANGVNMSSNVICMSGEKAVFPIFTTKMAQTIEKQRGVYVKFDFVGSWNAVWLISQPNAIYQVLSSDPNLQNNSEEWKTFGTYALNTSGVDFNMTRLQFMSAWDDGSSPKTAYIDNLAFIPAYKFTYVMPDGTEEYEYKITDENGNIITTYAPNKTAEWTDDSKKFVGWKVEGTEEVVETVALANADVTFYPVFEDLNAVNYYGFDGEVVKTVYAENGEYTLDFVLEDVNGKYFDGWKVEGTEEVVTSVNVTTDVKLYPVYTDKTDALETVEGQEMRFDGENATASIRFKSSITASEKNAADEFGFIVTRKTFLDKMAELGAADKTLETELTFDFKYKGADMFVSGISYQKDADGNVTVEKIIEETADGDSVFAAVLTGIVNNNADQVNETMVVRPYVKFTKDGKQFTFYGETAENSLVGVAKAVDTTELTENAKASIEAIVALENTAE